MSRGALGPNTPLPFNTIESRFLIGMTFRFMLRDVIFSSQRRHNQGVLHHAVWNLRREPVYREIRQYSYQDYFEKFAVPYYQSRGLALPVAETLEQAGDLRTYDAGLRANPNVRVISNLNDFLLTDEDVAWVRATFAASQVKLFENGGHLGNLFTPPAQEAILQALAGLNEPAAKSH